MRVLFLIAILVLTALSASAQPDTNITYQGQLQDANGPVTGTPGMEFRLFDSLTDGNQVGTEIVLSAVPVSDGLFKVELDFGAPYGAEPTYLEVMVDGETLSPRQRIAAAPLAIHALSLDDQFTDSRFWKLGGNAGTTPGTDILGTTDGRPLELHVNGVRALRLEPADGPNVIAGSAANHVASGVRGAFVAGGGDGSGNSVFDYFGTIGGGRSNEAGSDDGNLFLQFGATVGGGTNNTASDDYATVGGGYGNTASADDATVSGGDGNTAKGRLSTVGGGRINTASDEYSTVGGGYDNTASHVTSTVGGGLRNTASGSGGTVSGGAGNCAGGEVSWAGGRLAKVRPGSDSGDIGYGCGGVPLSGDADGDNGTFIWAGSRNADFVSTGENQFLVRADGGMGINTNNPDRDLHIKQRSTSNGEIGLQIERSGASTNNWGFYIATSDNLGFRYNDTLMSRINASDGAYVALSDARAKHSVEPLTGVLDRLLKLRPSSYRMEVGASSQTRSTGLIAQEVRELFPSSVSVQDGLHGIKYSEITVLNTAALIELNERYSNRIAELESESARRFAALEAESAALRELAERNRHLEKRLAALESILLANERVVRSD